jgi:hypothetical protein
MRPAPVGITAATNTPGLSSAGRRVASVAVLLVLLVGCTVVTQGAAGPAEPAASTGPATEVPTTGARPATPGLADVQPCELVDGAGLSALGLTGGGELRLGGARVCEWRYEGATLSESYTVAVALWDDQSLDDLQAPGIEPVPDIGSHRAVRFTDAAGACGIGLAVGATSRVDSSAVGGDAQQGCGLAAQLAAHVEPGLP